MRAFVEARVKPYYLHHGDLAPGTSHWRVPVAKGQDLMRELRGRLSGLATPSYMLDIPGGRGKVPVGPQWVRTEGEGRYVVIDPQGSEHVYVDRVERSGAILGAVPAAAGAGLGGGSSGRLFRD
jgi:lysine 2,3-aminomutase